MKTLIISLAALLFAFFVGCQSSITDPADTNNSESFLTAYSENYATKDWASSLPGVIDLGGEMLLPGLSVEQSVTIKGKVTYSIEKIHFDSRPPSPQFAYKVSLYVNATITHESSINDRKWIVKNISHDVVYPSTTNETMMFLEKSFTVRNARPAPLNLVLKFTVDEKELTLLSKTLKVSDGWATIGDPES